MSRSSNVIGPEFEVRLTPVPPDEVTAVLLKSKLPLEVAMLMPMPVGLAIVVEPLTKLPETVFKLIPVPPADMLAMVAVRAPLVRVSAPPVPFSVTSEMFSVTKPEPVISGAALPPVYPRRILF